jgi:lysyl-tRNA synthetase class 2
MAGSTLLAGTAERGRPRAADLDSSTSDELDRARAIVAAYGEDSLSPFLLRPDKSFAFAAGGVLAYRMFGRTAVVSSDPVGPAEAITATVAQLREKVRRDGGRVVLYGCSAHHLAAYRGLGLRAICVGEEAVVDPGSFGLQGRAVRKLRQSVNRMRRRGWELQAREGHQIEPGLEAEIAALERRWRSECGRMLGFAMAMGEFDPGIVPADLYLLARSPAGELAGVMRFVAHRGKLSLDTMRRVGETPNGLNEALVCAALGVARERGVPEVSLNYAGLAHLIRRPADGSLGEALRGPALRLLGRHFQMQRLVDFNEKFSPEWRPRYLVYESRASLPGSIVRILQAEGYLR